MQGRREEVTGGVYADIRRGLPTTENTADGPLSFAALSNLNTWAKADQLLDDIAELGYEVQDTPQGPVLIPRKS